MVEITEYTFDGQTVTLPDFVSNVQNSSPVSGMSFDLCHVSGESHYASGTPNSGQSTQNASLVYRKVTNWVSSTSAQNTLGQPYGIPAAGDYATPWLPDLVQSEQTRSPQGGIVSQVGYTYDDYSTLGQSGIATTNSVQHGAKGFSETYCTLPARYTYQPPDPNNYCGDDRHQATFSVPDAKFDSSISARGNVTAIIRALSRTGGMITTSSNYDDTGNAVLIGDANRNTTTISFQDSFAERSCAPSSGQMNAYVSSSTSPTGLVASSAVNSCDGSIASTQNANGETVATSYDFMGRTANVQNPAPAGGTATSCYSDSPQGNCAASSFPLSSSGTSQIDGATVGAKQVVVDGLGRMVQRTISDPFGAFVDWTDYDVMGRPSASWTPKRGATSHPAQDAGTMMQYDALGRLMTTRNPYDAQTPLTTRGQFYSGPSTTVVDEDGRQRVLIYDGLGRLASVCEPGSSSDTPSMQNAQATPRCAASNIETDYSYDALGNLTGVNQQDSTGNSVVRSFQYDWLSRLKSSNNPESGLLLISYDMQGMPCSGNPSLPCSIADARGVQRRFTYDTENRLIGRTYSDQTPPVTYSYGTSAQTNVHGVGRLIYESTGPANQPLTSRTVNLYDSMGRVLNETQCVQQVCDSLSFTWDFAGNLRSQTVGSTGTSLTKLSYHVNNANRVDTVSSDGSDPQHSILFQETAFDPTGETSASMSGVAGGAYSLGVDKQSNIRGWTTGASYSGFGTTQAAVPASAQVNFSFIGTNSGTHTLTIQYANDVNIPDSGGLLLFVSNSAGPVFVSYDSTSTAEGLAQQFAAGLGTSCTGTGQNQPSGFVSAVAQGRQVLLTDCSSNQSDNIRVQYAYSSASDNSTNPSMTFPVTGGSTPGEIQVVVGGAVQATYDYAVGTSSPADVVTQLANRLQNSSVVSAQAQGSTLMLIARASGTAGNGTGYTVLSSGSGGPPQFAAAPASGTLTQGQDAGYGPKTIYQYALTGYRPNGNLASVNDSLLGTWSYQYDQLNRIQQAATAGSPYNTDATNPSTIAWSYDAFGNRTRQALTGAANFALSQPDLSFTGNRMDYQNYDAAGNLLRSGQTVYDAEERLAADGTTGYLYDAEGTRVGKTSNGVLTTVYLLDAAGHELTEKDGAGNWRRTDVAGPWGMLATYDAAGAHYFVSDWQGTRRLQASAAGAVESVSPSLPFGEALPAPAGSPTAAPASTRQFTGKERDDETGLDYFGARYYSSAWGRWMSPDWSAKYDPVPYAKLTNPQTLNLYAYVGNNPLTNADADGHVSLENQPGAGSCGGGYNALGGPSSGCLFQAQVETEFMQEIRGITEKLDHEVNDGYMAALAMQQKKNKAAQQQNGQQLTYKTIGKQKDKSGAETWIQWKLAKPSQKGGFIVQHIHGSYTALGGTSDYWEAWKVAPHSTTTQNFADNGYDDNLNANTGSHIQAEARFYEGLQQLPSSFTVHPFPFPAGILHATTSDPHLPTTNATAPVFRTLDP